MTIGASVPYGVSGFSRTVQTVVKLGGSLLAHTQQLDAVLQTIALVSRERGLLVVPGGGPFADAVREVDRQARLPDTAAHWMAVLAMDQYAHVVVSRLRGSVLVSVPREVTRALENDLLPVLAPSRWLHEVDPLPHSWDVTSDSISAWVAGALGAARLVLVKPNSNAVHGVELVDRYFPRALPSGVTSAIVAADQIGTLESALRGT